MSQQITKQDIVEIIGKSNQEILEVVNESFSRLEEKMVTKDYLETRLERMQENLVTKDYLETRLTQMQTNLVTKDYLDEKMGDLYGKFFDAMRKVNFKVTTTVDELVKHGSLTKNSAKKILTMEPFPQSIN